MADFSIGILTRFSSHNIKLSPFFSKTIIRYFQFIVYLFSIFSSVAGLCLCPGVTVVRVTVVTMVTCSRVTTSVVEFLVRGLCGSCN